MALIWFGGITVIVTSIGMVYCMLTCKPQPDERQEFLELLSALANDDRTNGEARA